MIEHEFKYENYRIVVYVRCPKCGEIGRLNTNGRASYGYKFKICHKTSRKSYSNGIRVCNVSYFDGKVYEELKRIYERKVQLCEELRKRKGARVTRHEGESRTRKLRVQTLQ